MTPRQRHLRPLLTAALAAAFAAACIVGDPDQPLVVDEAPAPAEGERFHRTPEPIPNQYIVVLSEERTLRGNDVMMSMTSQLANDYAGSVVQHYHAALEGFVAVMTEQDAIALSQDPRVAFVEEDGYVYSQAVQNNATRGIDRIDQRNLPLDGVYRFDATGAGATVYVLDTGIRETHNDFGGRVGQGRNFINDGRGASGDCQGHGTHVAGTVGGTTFGVAKEVALVSMRVLGCDGRGSTSGIIAALDFVAANGQRPAVANLSLGGGASTALDNAVRRATEQGVVVVVAAGNANSDACGGSPARSPHAITVGSSTVGDARSSFSNFGRCVDIFAPGSSIVAASHTSNTGTRTLSGTSMAAPHVAGAAAMFLQSQPGATPAQVRDALIGNSTRNVLRSIGTSSPNALLFTGFINADGPDQTPPPPDEEAPGAGTPRTGSAQGSLTQGQTHRYQPLPVLGGTPVRISITGTGDADLYVRINDAPTFQQFNCRPFLDGSNETCAGTLPAGAETVHIMVHGFRAASYTLNAEWVEP